MAGRGSNPGRVILRSKVKVYLICCRTCCTRTSPKGGADPSCRPRLDPHPCRATAWTSPTNRNARSWRTSSSPLRRCSNSTCAVCCALRPPRHPSLCRTPGCESSRLRRDYGTLKTRRISCECPGAGSTKKLQPEFSPAFASVAYCASTRMPSSDKAWPVDSPLRARNRPRFPLRAW